MASEKFLSKRADPLLKLFVKKVKDQFNERVIAIFKIGSLGSHGDFSLCSDVDVVLMLDEIKASDYDAIQKLWEHIKTADIEYADRLSVFWSSYDKDAFEHGIGRFPPHDRLDFIRHGILMAGIDHRAELPQPEHKAIVLASAEFITAFMLAGEKIDKLTQHPEKILAEGARYFTKFVLFPVRLIFTLDYPGVIGSNKEAVEHFNKALVAIIPAAKEIVNLAYIIRNTPADSPVLMEPEKLRLALIPLYDYCINRYKEATLALGETKLSAQLEAAHKRLRNA